MTLDPVALGQQFVAELRAPFDEINDSADNQSATDLMRWDGDELDDETLWAAVMAAVEMLEDDGERWQFGDGLIDESVATRPALRELWHAESLRNQSVRAVFRVMHEPGWNWGYGENDASHPAGWWSEGPWWKEARALRSE